MTEAQKLGDKDFIFLRIFDVVWMLCYKANISKI